MKKKKEEMARFYLKLPDYSKGETKALMEVSMNVHDNVMEFWGELFDFELKFASEKTVEGKLIKYSFLLSEEKTREALAIMKTIGYQHLIKTVGLTNN